MRRLFLIAALPLVLAACATARSASPPATDGVSSYGMFLAGEAALNDGRSAEAARWFSQAFVRHGGDPLVGERAFTAALLAGDVTRAAAFAPDDPQASEAAKRMGRLVQAVEAMAEGKGRQANAIFATRQIAFPHQSAGALLAPWAAAMAGDVEGSLVRPQVNGDRVVDYFGLLGQGRLFERARRYDEAETDFKASTTVDASSEMAVLAYGTFLERRGRRVDAVAIYDAALSQDPENLAIAGAKARAASGKAPPPPPSLREGAAQALLASAAAMVSGKQNQLALAYLQLVLRLDPQRDDAWVMVGDLMLAAGDTAGARQAYARPRPGAEDYVAAQAKLAWSYQNEGSHEAALKIARAVATTEAGPEARLALADLLRANKHYDEAVGILSELIKETARPDWRLYFARGVALHQLDRWPEAEKDLQAALAQRPEEPELLNYLGYSWIDRGERLKEALSMVERAVAQNPNSGAMVDSLGWAHFRLGDHDRAVELLEQAVGLEGGDPEINDHLGDAYWKVGRRDEALFQWRRVLTLQPDAKIKAAAEAKLAAGGLGPDGAAARLAGQ